LDVSDDVAEHKDWLLSLMPAPKSGIWVDLGCGDGSDVRRLAARQTTAGLRIVGIDGNREVIEEAQRHTGDDPRLEFRSYSLGRTLPFDDASVDVAYSNNLIECLPDVSSFISELTRVLRPGGLVVMAHWDWDSQMFDGGDKNRNRRLVHAFCDWQQDWMEHADGWMGRRLWSTFNSTARFDGLIHTRVLTNSVFSPGHFGFARAQDMRELVKRGLDAQCRWITRAHRQVVIRPRSQYGYAQTLRLWKLA
jgi:SAM-dependent methyltransferase